MRDGNGLRLPYKVRNRRNFENLLVFYAAIWICFNLCAAALRPPPPKPEIASASALAHLSGAMHARHGAFVVAARALHRAGRRTPLATARQLPLQSTTVERSLPDRPR